MTDTGTAAVKSVLVSNGITPRRIRLISSSREPVYRVVSDDGEYYVKILSEKKGEAMNKVINRRLNIGVPDSRMIRDDEYVLLMDPAHGRPLSVYLPICLLPGVWRTVAERVLDAVNVVGSKIGNLHTGTYRGERQPDDPECRMAKRLELGSMLYDYFDGETTHDIEDLFDEIRTKELPFTRIHGDPTPHNIFVAIQSRETAIIDFNLHESIALEDLVVFESGIELMTARLPYGRSSQGEAMRKSFRLGYTEKGVHDSIVERDIDILKLSYYCHLLEKYLRRVEPDTTREKWTRHTDRVIVRRKIKALRSDLLN